MSPIKSIKSKGARVQIGSTLTAFTVASTLEDMLLLWFDMYVIDIRVKQIADIVRNDY